jgi:hypothetical protein
MPFSFNYLSLAEVFVGQAWIALLDFVRKGYESAGCKL